MGCDKIKLQKVLLRREYMKLIKTFFIGAATLALSSCAMGGGVSAKGQRVSEEQFEAEANKIEKGHQHSEATVKYSIAESHKNDGGENVNVKGQIKFTHGDSGWTLNAGQNVPEVALEGAEAYVGMTIDVGLGGLPSGSQYNVKYYKAPLGASYSMSQKSSESGSSYSYSIAAVMEFDNYGYVIRVASKGSSSSKVSVAGVSASSSYSTTSEITITYK